MSILPNDEDERQSGKKSAAQQLVELALDVFDLGVDDDGKAFAVRKGGHVARPLLNSRFSVRKELGGLFYRATGKPASQNALTEAMAVLEAEAEDAGEPRKLFLRAARSAFGEIYIDMGDKDERVINISSKGWEILDAINDVPVIFQRTTLTAALPTPERGGDLEQIWRFVNMSSEDDRQVLRGWLVAAHVLVGLPCPILALLGEQGTAQTGSARRVLALLDPPRAPVRPPRPILALLGEQGPAKTSSARRVFALIDPTTAPVRRPPKDADAYLHAVHSSRGSVFDNLSSIQHWFSDAMCRTVTGDADVGRTFYTNGDAYVIKVQGILGFTGIDVGSLNGDLAERSVWGNLERIPATKRKSESELNAAWDETYPSMLGGLLDLVVKTLQKLPEVDLAEKPRMADFAEVLAALDLATGASGLEYYTLSQESVASSIVATDDFLVALADKVTERWEGTGADLFKLLPMPVTADAKYWPRARGVDGALKRRAPDLRKAGWTVDAVVPDPRSKRAKTWILVPPEDRVVSDSDLAAAQRARALRDLDVEEWEQRVLADGAIPDCASMHVDAHRQGLMFHCTDAPCTASMWRPEYMLLAERSKSVDREMNAALGRLQISRPDLDRLIAKQAALKAAGAELMGKAEKLVDLEASDLGEFDGEAERSEERRVGKGGRARGAGG